MISARHCMPRIIIIIIIIITIIIIIIITSFKCQVYLALRHTNWGQCKLKLIQIKFNQMQVFEERGTREKPLRAEKITNKLDPHLTPSLEIEPRPYWWEASALTTTA